MLVMKCDIRIEEASAESSEGDILKNVIQEEVEENAKSGEHEMEEVEDKEG